MKALLVALPIFCLVASACSKCSDCTLTKINNNNDTTTSVERYCGQAVKDIESNANYKDSVYTYSWKCE